MTSSIVCNTYRPAIAESPPTRRRDQRRTTPLGGSFFIVWILVVVDGIWVYAQLKIFGRKALPLSPFVVLFLFSAAMWATAVRGQTLAPARTVLPFWLMGCYLLVALMVQTGRGWADVVPAVHGYYVYYFFLLFLPLQWQLSGTLRERTASAVLLALGAALAALAIAQHFMGDLFDVGRAVSEEALAFNLSMQGQIRANGLFAHAEDLGHFLALAGGLALAAALATRDFVTKVGLAVLFVLLALGCYSSFTRSSYIAFAMTALCTILLYRSGGKSRWAAWYPVLFLVLGLGIFFGRSLLSGMESRSVLFSAASVGERVYLSTRYWEELKRSGILAVLFGKGWILYSHPRAVLPIDNNFLAIALNIGVIGLALWSWVTYRVWMSCLAMLRARPSPVQAALVGAYSPWLMLSVFGTINLYQMIALLIVTVHDHDEH